MILDLAIHKCCKLFGGKNMLQFLLHLYHTLHGFVTCVADIPQSSIFEMHVKQRVTKYTIRDIQLSNQHLCLLLSYI